MPWRSTLLVTVTVLAHLVAAGTPCLPARPTVETGSVHVHAAGATTHGHDHAHAPDAGAPGHVHGAPMDAVDSAAPVLTAPCPCGCDRVVAPATGSGRLGPAIPTALERPRWEGRPLGALPSHPLVAERPADAPEPIPIPV